MAAEYVTAPAQSFTNAPAGYSFAQAATLACAARALMVEARIKPGDTVLVLGTGRRLNLRLSVCESRRRPRDRHVRSAAKLERLRALGADHIINYADDPKWGKTAKPLTGGRGVDAVVEIGGPATLGQSIAACRMGGHISLIGVLTGVLTGVKGEVPTAAFFYSNLTMAGITVGSRSQQQDMVRAIEAAGIEPVIDTMFALNDLADAFRYQAAQKHFGKICLDI